MTIETTIKSKDTETILLATDGSEIRLPTTLLPQDVEVGTSLWVSIDKVPPVEPSPKEILNELLGSDQYEEAV
jgi:hypothetical protein